MKKYDRNKIKALIKNKSIENFLINTKHKIFIELI